MEKVLVLIAIVFAIAAGATAFTIVNPNQAYLDLETWRRFVSSAGFVELTHYYRPAGLPPERQPWLASIWRR
jgi:hypothetical protein